jgi:hypothetical protein
MPLILNDTYTVPAGEWEVEEVNVTISFWSTQPSEPVEFEPASSPVPFPSDSTPTASASRSSAHFFTLLCSLLICLARLL